MKSRRWMFEARESGRSPELQSGSLRFPKPVTKARAQRSIRWLLQVPAKRAYRVRVWPY